MNYTITTTLPKDLYFFIKEESKFRKTTYKTILKEAVENKNLTPYYYYPIFVSLTDDEEYFNKELTEKIFNMIKMGHDIDEPDSALKALLLKRANI